MRASHPNAWLSILPLNPLLPSVISPPCPAEEGEEGDVEVNYAVIEAAMGRDVARRMAEQRQVGIPRTNCIVCGCLWFNLLCWGSLCRISPCC